MMEQSVLIPCAEGWLAADVMPGDREAILILPGWGGTRYGPQRILQAAARELAASGGYSTLRLDFRGRGESSGDPETVSLDGMIEDVMTAIAWLQNTQGINTIGLVGLCSGGNVALGAASLLPEVKHVVCWSLLPFMEHKALVGHSGKQGGAMMGHLFRKAFQPDAWKKLFAGEANVGGAVNAMRTNKEGSRDEQERKRSSRDILGALTEYKGRLHLIYGSKDPEAEGSRQLYEQWCKLNHIPVDIRVIDGAPHNYYTVAWTNEVIAQTVAWFDENEDGLKITW